jgi:hypothetical protein
MSPTCRGVSIGAVIGAVAIFGGVAGAQEVTRLPGTYRMVPVQTPPNPHAVSSRIIFIHKCGPGGCSVTPGAEDSRLDRSSIPNSAVTLDMFKQTDEVWNRMMTCVKATFAPFDVTITDVDPGNVPHFENMVGGRGSQLHPDFASAGGVSPFTCDEIPNAISFTFDVYGPDPDQLCWTVSQEVAHSFGLDHEYNASDPLTYLNGGPSMKRFQATDSPCGEYTSRPCDAKCPGVGATQNSYERILAFFGPGTVLPPTVKIKLPADGKKVTPGFRINATAMDDVGIDHLELWIDGMDTGATADTVPYLLTAPLDLSEGEHVAEVIAYDVQSAVANAQITVDVGPPCTQSSGCSGTDACVMGVCLPGPDQPGGLGRTCNANTECLSNRCVSDSTGDSACVESCAVGQDTTCPSEFSCIEDGTGAGVCWHTGGGGCCDAGSGPAGPALLGLGLFAIVFGRRRRRR